MTPEERAAALSRHYADHLGVAMSARDWAEVERLTAAAIREAVAAERERCAAVALRAAESERAEWGDGVNVPYDACMDIAARIREGGVP